MPLRRIAALEVTVDAASATMLPTTGSAAETAVLTALAAAASAEPRLPAYALTVELHRPFHAALRDVRSALEAEELQLWQEQDLTALLGHGCFLR